MDICQKRCKIATRIGNSIIETRSNQCLHSHLKVTWHHCWIHFHKHSHSGRNVDTFGSWCGVSQFNLWSTNLADSPLKFNKHWRSSFSKQYFRYQYICIYIWFFLSFQTRKASITLSFNSHYHFKKMRTILQRTILSSIITENTDASPSAPTKFDSHFSNTATASNASLLFLLLL